MNVSANPTDFSDARRAAFGKAAEKLSQPVIIAWKDDKTDRFAPEIPGGKGDRWHDYGESNGGKLELNVGHDFHFIFSEAADFEEPDIKPDEHLGTRRHHHPVRQQRVHRGRPGTHGTLPGRRYRRLSAGAAPTGRTANSLLDAAGTL